MFTAGIITISDKGYAGQRDDASGPAIERLLKTIGGRVAGYKIVPDDMERISQAIIHMTDDKGIDLVLTTGGTGFSQRDITPEATWP